MPVYDWAFSIPRARVFDRSLGKEIEHVIWIDTDTGRYEAMVIDEDGDNMKDGGGDAIKKWKRMKPENILIIWKEDVPNGEGVANHSE